MFQVFRHVQPSSIPLPPVNFLVCLVGCRGTPVPDINYTAEELHVWASVLGELTGLLQLHACQDYLAALPLFGFRPDRVPQLREMNDVLQVGGVLTQRGGRMGGC